MTLVAEPLRPPRPAGSPPQRRTHLSRSTRGWSRAILWSLTGLSVFGAVVGWMARIDSSVSAAGKLRPVGGSVDVSAPIQAPIRRVLVRDGETVRAGQLLVELEELDAGRQSRDLLALRELWRKDANQAAQQLGLPALAVGGRELAAELHDTDLRRRAADQRRLRSLATLRQQVSDLEALERKKAINDGIQQRMAGLVRQGAISRLELDRQEERQVDLEGTIRRTRQELLSAQRGLAESELNLEQVGSLDRRQLYVRYDEARRQLLETSTRLEQLRSRLKLGRILAPAAGEVFDLRAKPGELAGARPLMRIVPRRTLEVELAISNRDIGFLTPGMPVDVRITSLPFTDYGSLRGRLTRIGADALPADPRTSQEMFAAVVRLERSSLMRQGRIYPLRAGMAATGLIQLGTRPLLALIYDRVGGFLDATRSIR
jgi:HlyD family secretion protein